MAVYFNQGVEFKIGSASPSVTLSDHVSSATLTWKYDSLEITSMGDLAHKYVQGLQSGQLDLEIFNDLAATNVTATLNSLVGQTAYCSLKQTSAATSPTNPLYSFNIFVDQVTPVVGAVGEMSSQSLSYQLTSVVTKTEA
jgi:hypothetical protein